MEPINTSQPPDPRSVRELRWVLLAGLLLTNVLFIGLAADSLLRSRELYEQRARNLTENVTLALHLNVSKNIEKLDLALNTVVDELQRQLAGKQLDEQAMSAFLALQEKRLPEVEAFRVSRADGLVILGKGLVKDARSSWADRDEFIFLRDHPGAGLQIQKPRMGRVAKQYIVGFSRRYNYPDGSFAGIVAAPIAVDHFTRLLSQFDVGPKGTLLLRDAALGLITRVPPLLDNPAGQLGSQSVPSEFRRVFESGATTATDLTTTSPDGYQRIFTFHRMQFAPMVTIVATSSEDYLKGWSDEAYRTSAMTGGFLVLSILLVFSQLRLLRGAEQHSRKLRDHQTFVSNILDSLGEHVAVIDAQGIITAVNASWRRFAAENGAPKDANAFIGMNYLSTCKVAACSERSELSLDAFEGIRSVLLGVRAGFSIKYPCDSPTEQRWFILNVTPLMGANLGAVLIHQNVTQQHQAEASLRASEEHFRMLAENMTDIVWRADMQLRFTYINAADQQIRGFEPHEVLGTDITDALTPQGNDVLKAMAEKRSAIELSGDKGVALNFEIPMRHKNGGEVWIDLSSIPSYDTTGNIMGFQGIGRDVSERKRRESQWVASHQLLENQLKEVEEAKLLLQEQSVHDPLTGIFNRRYLDDALPRELARAAREAYSVAIVMIDLDHFKSVNDQYGHAAGDEVLRALAKLLKNGARASDIVCRFGGEEFVAIMPKLGVDLVLQRVESWRVELQDMVVTYGELCIGVTMSAGVAIFPNHGDNSERLLVHADEMLYRSKKDGRNRITVYANEGLI